MRDFYLNKLNENWEDLKKNNILGFENNLWR